MTEACTVREVLLVRERQQAHAMLETLNRDLKATVASLAHSNQELQDFAHVAAHDLQVPLRGIGTLVDWIVQDCGERLSVQGQEYLRLLQQRTGRMGRLLDGVLRYVEIGQDKLHFESADANAVVADVLEQMEPPTHIAIQRENPLPVVFCDRSRLAQVFQNLLGNAVQYLDKPDGEIRVGCAEEGEFWRFHVTDNGPGIAERHFERIFRIFQTLAPKEDGDSTGIGLTLVKKIVERYGGKVWVESAVGQGSTFYFTWPKMKMEE